MQKSHLSDQILTLSVLPRAELQAVSVVNGLNLPFAPNVQERSPGTDGRSGDMIEMSIKHHAQALMLQSWPSSRGAVIIPSCSACALHHQ